MSNHQVLEPAAGRVAGGRAAGARQLPRRILESQVGPFIGVGSVLVILLVVEAFVQSNFYEPGNLTNLGRALGVPLVLAAGMTLALLTGGVDLSIGSSLALSGTLYAKLYTGGTPPVPALVICLAFGLIVGFAINGFLIGRLNMSFFVVTLGTLSLFRGIVYLWTNSETISMYEDSLTQKIGNETTLGGHVPIALLIAVATVVAIYLMLRLTTFGRQIYAVGGNREAARLSGVRTDWVIAAVYAITGLCAALAAIMTIGRTASVDPKMGESLELNAAAAVLLGGVSLSGGSGSIWGAVLGVVFLEVLANALALAGTSTSWQLIVTGVILVVAVYLDRLRARANQG